MMEPQNITYKDVEEKALDLFYTYDLSLYSDLFGWWFAADPMCRLYTPCFKEPEQVAVWLVENTEQVRKVLG